MTTKLLMARIRRKMTKVESMFMSTGGRDLEIHQANSARLDLEELIESELKERDQKIEDLTKGCVGATA